MTEYKQGETVNMDRIVEIIKAEGFYAYVEQTGGGCATIYSSDRSSEQYPGAPAPYLINPLDGEGRYPVIAGPGWFEGPGWTNARGALGDFYVGPDDDGERTPWEAGEGETEETIAERMIFLLSSHAMLGMVPEAQTTEHVERWLKAATRYLGMGFHPDTRFPDYVITGTGVASFSAHEQAIHEQAIEQAFAVCTRLDVDLYGLGLDALHRIDPLATDDGEDQ